MKTKINWNRYNEGYINGNHTLNSMYYSFKIISDNHDDKIQNIYYYDDPKDLEIINETDLLVKKIHGDLGEAKIWCERFLKLKTLRFKNSQSEA